MPAEVGKKRPICGGTGRTAAHPQYALASDVSTYYNAAMSEIEYPATITMRATKDTTARYRAAAWRAQMSLGNYLRQVLDGTIPAIPPTQAADVAKETHDEFHAE
jgi:hypothetical protein